MPERDAFERLFAKFTDAQREIARDCWPDGGRLECWSCGLVESFSALQAGVYLRSGWPQHCQRTMTVKAR